MIPFSLSSGASLRDTKKIRNDIKKKVLKLFLQQWTNSKEELFVSAVAPACVSTGCPLSPLSESRRGHCTEFGRLLCTHTSCGKYFCFHLWCPLVHVFSRSSEESLLCASCWSAVTEIVLMQVMIQSQH